MFRRLFILSVITTRECVRAFHGPFSRAAFTGHTGGVVAPPYRSPVPHSVVALLRNDLGQIVHITVLQSPSAITGTAVKELHSYQSQYTM